MFQLGYLEDPGLGQAAIHVMLTQDAADSLKMYCRGSDR